MVRVNVQPDRKNNTCTDRLVGREKGMKTGDFFFFFFVSRFSDAEHKIMAVILSWM